MRFSEIYRRPRVLSLEFFPPKADSALPETFELIGRLARFRPDFMTVTYGAGGTQLGAARELVTYIHRELGLPAVQHLTCGSHSIAEIDQITASLADAGITNILALRGDPPKGSSEFVPHVDGFSCARDLARHLNLSARFSIAVAGYPETHR